MYAGGGGGARKFSPEAAGSRYGVHSRKNSAGLIALYFYIEPRTRSKRWCSVGAPESLLAPQNPQPSPRGEKPGVSELLSGLCCTCNAGEKAAEGWQMILHFTLDSVLLNTLCGGST